MKHGFEILWFARRGALVALTLTALLTGCSDGSEDDVQLDGRGDSTNTDTTTTRPGDVDVADSTDTRDPDPFDMIDLDALDAGERVYRMAGVAGGNSFACSTCHALDEPAEDGIRRVGHRLGDAVLRPHYKNGQLTSLRDAANTCVSEWMNGTAWQDDDAEWVALETFLRDQAPADAVAAEPVTVQVVMPPADLSGGDPRRGHELFDTSCSACHGIDAVGTNRAPMLRETNLQADYIALRVRTSGLANSPTYDGLTGGIMPFWGADRLSDDELRDLVAWVVEVGQPVVEPMDPAPDMTDVADAPDTVDTAMPTDTTPSGCASTHPRVGQSVEVIGRFHDVSGTAVVVDDCTVVIEDFTFDGNGIDVRWYAATGGDFNNGFAVSDDLFGHPSNGEDFVITLPAGTTHDDFDSLSVWCVDVGVSFGDLSFPRP